MKKIKDKWETRSEIFADFVFSWVMLSVPIFLIGALIFIIIKDFIL